MNFLSFLPSFLSSEGLLTEVEDRMKRPEFAHSRRPDLEDTKGKGRNHPQEKIRMSGRKNRCQQCLRFDFGRSDDKSSVCRLEVLSLHFLSHSPSKPLAGAHSQGLSSFLSCCFLALI